MIVPRVTSNVKRTHVFMTGLKRLTEAMKMVLKKLFIIDSSQYMTLIHTVKALLFVDVNFRGSSKLPGIVGSYIRCFIIGTKIIWIF